MFNIRLSLILYFEKSFFNLRVKTSHIKIFGIFDGFKLEFKVETKVFKN
jgi:hypothetical protein